MLALMVGGPLNGKVLEVEPDAAAGLSSADDAGVLHRYVRRTVYTYAGQARVLFACGELDYGEVLEAIRLSHLAETGRRRGFGPGVLSLRAEAS